MAMKNGEQYIDSCPYCAKIKWIHSKTCGVKECEKKDGRIKDNGGN